MLYVIDSLAPDGAETSLVELTPGLLQAGIDLHVFPLGKALDLQPRLEEAGAIVHSVPADSSSRAANVRRVMRKIAGLDPDLVHTTLYEADIAGRTAARLSGTPTSSSIVGDTYGRPMQGAKVLKLHAARILDRRTARFATRFHAVSSDLAQKTVRHLKVQPTRIEVIPRGRDSARFPFKPPGVRQEVRQELGIASSAPVVLAVGRLERVKGLHSLIRAVPQLRLLFPDLRVIIAGREGASEEELRRLAAPHGDHVRFLGHRTDVAQLLTAADVLCFPSLSEGSPGVLIEAMAAGCPIVASDIAANREVLGTDLDHAGILVPVENSHAIAEGLGALLQGRVDVQSMGRIGRERFVNHFETAAIAKRMASFFDRAAS